MERTESKDDEYIAVSYDAAVVGERCADLLVDERVIIVVSADKYLDSLLETFEHVESFAVSGRR